VKVLIFLLQKCFSTVKLCF